MNSQVLQKILFWGAVVCGIAAGIAGLVAGIVLKQPAYAIWGGVFISGSVIMAIAGGKGRPDGAISPPTIGAKFKEVPDWAWVVISLLFIPGIIFTFVFRPWH